MHYQDHSFEDWQYLLSKPEEVLIKAAILLEEDGASMQRFMNLTSLSRGTISKVIKSIKQDFNESGLLLYYQKGTGYQLEGPEDAKRTMLSNILATIFSNPEWQNVRNEVYKMIQPEAATWSEETDERHLVREVLLKLKLS